eukprot:maker-scaffold1069_size64751-snap-gene-0.12 protein:Tk02461 transcript:maker-scaffold1069_size64751-snap-gene-0.12-mRNA-1 annotation:"hypothetical protein L798_04225"
MSDRFCLASSEVIQVALGLALQRAPGVPENPLLQYHIQTDQGPERFFRFQTLSGQYRKEIRHEDGSVEGAYGWVDPNGVLRLFDYVSDDQGYRIVKQSLFKVGTPMEDGITLATRGGDMDLGFEVFPLDLDSDPAFNGMADTYGGVPLGGSSGLRSIHGPDGNFHLTPSYQVASLTSTNDPSNPISKQGQATYFEGDPILVKSAPVKPTIMVGARRSQPSQAPQRTSIVIGYGANNEEIRRPAYVAADSQSSFRAVSPLQDSISSRSDRRRSGIVIGRTAKMLALGSK